MNNTIIGTAGHVDHGKTLLIKALTGMETDRLKEEKKRGITIELGFAYLDLPNGGKAGIVDVPGHEKFVRNMLAGAGSIDLAMLVIAADEGIMPQTREHLAILSMLGIGRGLVVLNKVDLVDKDWLDMVILDIEEELAGTFLENAQIMPVSAYTGQGMDELKQVIFHMLQQSPPKDDDAPFRLPVDRVFTMDGFGTVVTGTLIEGSLRLGDDVEIYPSGHMAKARRIQVHGGEVERATAGQRVAVNLAGLKVSDLEKGDWAAKPASLENSRLLDVVVEIDKNMEREIKNNSRLHLYHGTRDVLCNLLLLDNKPLVAGQRAYAQLKLEEPLASNIYDRFVLRFYSPMETVGGGIILDPVAMRWKRHDEATPGRFAAMESGTLAERVGAAFGWRSPAFPKVAYIRRRYFKVDEADFDGALQQLINDGVLINLGGQAIHRDYLRVIGAKAQNILNRFHAANPLQGGMGSKELISRLLPKLQQSLAEKVLGELAADGMVKENGGFVAHKDFKPTATADHSKIESKLLEMYQNGGFAPPELKDVAAEFSKGQAKEKKAFEQVFGAMVSGGVLVALTPQIHLHRDFYDKAFDTFKTMAGNAPEVLTKDYRDELGTSRKYAMAILEYFDKKAITKMTGEGRVLLNEKN
ncbi:MAG: selenocysteine-specific translation elongation factor [Defluviitaleaceae bacterium]|nr:selenocysteine-specific translation elongation factor [Defluviitaleaceae bacterium]